MIKLLNILKEVNVLIESLSKLNEKYNELGEKISSGEIDYSSKEFKKLTKEFNSLKPTIELYNKLLKINEEIKESEDIISNETDKEFRLLAKEELDKLKEEKEKMESELKYSLIPTDPNSGKNTILEIRPGTGGDESTLFCGDLFRLYSRYIEKMNWKLEIINLEDNGIGGFKEVIMSISGQDAYDKLKYETGVHRVQRVPKTESSGRIHTSAVTVAVLPEADEEEMVISPNDLRIDTYRSGGAGGQHVNTTDSAVRITHLPTNLVVICQDEKSQIKNRNKAMRVLRTRLKEKIEREHKQKVDSERKNQVGSGDRSERIRTYNFSENRITDHRVNYKAYNLDKFMDGELNEVIELLIEHFKNEAIKEIVDKK